MITRKSSSEGVSECQTTPCHQSVVARNRSTSGDFLSTGLKRIGHDGTWMGL